MAPVRRRPSHGTPEPITFGHAGAAELLGTAVLHLASKPGFALKRRYLESKGLWQSDAPFGNATMTPEDAHAEAARGVASFNATFLELEGRPAQGARKKEERKEERKELGRSRRGKAAFKGQPRRGARDTGPRGPRANTADKRTPPCAGSAK